MGQLGYSADYKKIGQWERSFMYASYPPLSSQTGTGLCILNGPISSPHFVDSQGDQRTEAEPES